MKRAIAVAAMAAVLVAGACSDDENSPQSNNTGDTLEDPTTSGPPSTTAP